MPGQRRKSRKILIVNDDGIGGEGLRPLVQSLGSAAKVWVLVPEQERSAASHSLTLHKPLRLKKNHEGFHTLNGSPADCARFGILKLVGGQPDLLLSGINRGHNLGQDVLYSGTVAAASEGALLGIPSIALSRGIGPGGYEPLAGFARVLVERILSGELVGVSLLNVNAPALPPAKIRGHRFAKLGDRVYDKTVTVRVDPRGDSYFWMTGRKVTSVLTPGTDVDAVSKGFISVTPLSLDKTDLSALHRMKSWKF